MGRTKQTARKSTQGKKPSYRHPDADQLKAKKPKDPKNPKDPKKPISGDQQPDMDTETLELKNIMSKLAEGPCDYGFREFCSLELPKMRREMEKHDVQGWDQTENRTSLLVKAMEDAWRNLDEFDKQDYEDIAEAKANHKRIQKIIGVKKTAL